jgi:hypothetical protein
MSNTESSNVARLRKAVANEIRIDHVRSSLVGSIPPRIQGLVNGDDFRLAIRSEWVIVCLQALSRAQPSIPALTPPAEAGAKGARALGTPVDAALSGGAS